MGRIHEVLRWANRREVAREVTKRGYRVSGETLNRWVRDESEFPAVVERIVFTLFTIGGHEETSAPSWAEATARSSWAAKCRSSVRDKRRGRSGRSKATRPRTRITSCPNCCVL